MCNRLLWEQWASVRCIPSYNFIEELVEEALLQYPGCSYPVRAVLSGGSLYGCLTALYIANSNPSKHLQPQPAQKTKPREIATRRITRHVARSSTGCVP
eukprot:scaffold24180_cov157-Isochrysis_galbana.AAC.1